jgi:hypothetical protein
MKSAAGRPRCAAFPFLDLDKDALKEGKHGGPGGAGVPPAFPFPQSGLDGVVT